TPTRSRCATEAPWSRSSRGCAPCDRVAGAQTWGLRQLPLPRRAVPDAALPPSLRRARGQSRGSGRRRGRPHPAPGRQDDGDVEAALAQLLEARARFDCAAAEALVKPRESVVPTIDIPTPDLTSYNALIVGPA